MARRLAERSDATVLLIEAGPSDVGVAAIDDAARWTALFRSAYDWGYDYAPTPYVNGRIIHIPRGRVLGGSSSINAMTWNRGHPSDYDAWEAAGATGWNFATVLPYFKRAEDWEGGETSLRGAGGPLRIERPRDPHPLARATIEAAVALGVPRIDDMNGPSNEGAALANLNAVNGVRWSVSRGYLRPVMERLCGAVLEEPGGVRLSYAGPDCRFRLFFPFGHQQRVIQLLGQLGFLRLCFDCRGDAAHLVESRGCGGGRGHFGIRGSVIARRGFAAGLISAGILGCVVAIQREYLEERLSNASRQTVLYRYDAEKARETERQRIAADFHDGPLQSFISFQMRLEIIRKLLLRDVGSATEELVQLQELCKNQVNELRSFVRSMRPVDVEGSLNATLRRVVEQFQKDSGIPSSFVSAEFLEPAEPEVSLSSLQIVREALYNVQKHGSHACGREHREIRQSPGDHCRHPRGTPHPDRQMQNSSTSTPP